MHVRVSFVQSAIVVQQFKTCTQPQASAQVHTPMACALCTHSGANAAAVHMHSTANTASSPKQCADAALIGDQPEGVCLELLHANSQPLLHHNSTEQDCASTTNSGGPTTKAAGQGFSYECAQHQQQQQHLQAEATKAMVAVLLLRALSIFTAPGHARSGAIR